jgi:S1-C subfamily serine protease
MDQRPSHATARIMLAAGVLSAFIASISTVALVTLAPTGGGDSSAAIAPAATSASTTGTGSLTSSGVVLDDPAIVAAADPSVVTIATDAGRVSGVGSGIVLTSDGLILTNDHVVAGGGALSVTLFDGRTLDATIVSEDAANDLAIIRVAATDLTPAKLGDSTKVQVGESVLAIGSPLGTYTESVTKGIVSGLDREITVRSEITGRPVHLTHLIQTDAAINPGNSGGPLIDETGAVIGITAATSANAEGLGFAIPIETAKALIAAAEGAA